MQQTLGAFCAGNISTALGAFRLRRLNPFSFDEWVFQGIPLSQGTFNTGAPLLAYGDTAWSFQSDGNANTWVGTWALPAGGATIAKPTAAVSVQASNPYGLPCTGFNAMLCVFRGQVVPMLSAQGIFPGASIESDAILPYAPSLLPPTWIETWGLNGHGPSAGAYNVIDCIPDPATGVNHGLWLSHGSGGYSIIYTEFEFNAAGTDFVSPFRTIDGLFGQAITFTGSAASGISGLLNIERKSTRYGWLLRSPAPGAGMPTYYLASRDMQRYWGLTFEAQGAAVSPETILGAGQVLGGPTLGADGSWYYTGPGGVVYTSFGLTLSIAQYPFSFAPAFDLPCASPCIQSNISATQVRA